MSERPFSILVIKLGALGDIVQALGPFQSIRHHHPLARITLLTTQPYVNLAEVTGLFDEIWLDEKPGALQIPGWWTLRRRLRQGRFDRVYDLQTSDRSGFYFRLFWPGPVPEWSGIAQGCSHPHRNPERDFMHTIERQAEQLKMAGIKNIFGPETVPKLKMLDADISKYDLPKAFGILVPGGAPHRPEKRWPPDHFISLSKQLAAADVKPVLLGAEAESAILSRIADECPEALNLCGRTDLLEIAGLARKARFAIGNDTGPMHLISALGCRSVILYSKASDPALCAQRGASVTIIRRDNLSQINAEEALIALNLG